MARSFGTRVFHGFAMTAAAGAFQAALQFGSLIILARLISPDAFGLVYPIAALFLILTAFLTAGVEQAMVQRAEIDPDTDCAVVQLLFGGSLAAFVIVNVTIPFVVGADASTATYVVSHVLSLLLPVHAARAYAHGWLSHQLAFRRLAVLSTVHNMVFVGLAVLLAFVLQNPLALAVPMVAQWAVYLPFCRRALPLLLQRPRKLAVYMDLLRFGGPMTGATISQNVVQQIDQVASGFFAPQVAGLYNRASMLANIPGRIGNMMAKQLGLAAFAKLRDEPTRLAQAYRRSVVLLALGGLPATVFMAYHARTLIEVILGSQWLAGAGVFMILVLLVHVRIIRRLPAWIVVATNHPWHYFVCEVCFVVLKAGLCFGIGLRSIELLAAAVTVAHLIEFAVIVGLAGHFSGVGIGAFVRAHSAGAVLASVLLAVMVGVDQLVGGTSLAQWQMLLLHLAACGMVVLLLLVTRLLRRIDADHRWVSDQIENTALLLRRRMTAGKTGGRDE